MLSVSLRLWLVTLVAAVLPAAIACSSGPGAQPATTAPASPTASQRPSVTVPTATLTPSASPTPAETAAPAAHLEPDGFPLPPATRVDLVVGEKGARRMEPGAGPAPEEYSARDQVLDDPARANAGGWNCRTHVAFEGKPAVDWYVRASTPVYTTMDGQATLRIVTLANAFDVYGVDREPYQGDPDRARAAIDPFGGRPGGGKGVYVEVVSSGFRVNYGHLSLAPTLGVLPADAFLGSFDPSYDYGARFSALRRFDTSDAIASWPVRAGDVIGFTGDSGYSEAPHLHYEIASADGNWLCPTRESGFPDNGWLFRQP